MIVRHPIAVALTTYKRNKYNALKGRSARLLVEHPLLAHERFAADVHHLRRVRVVAYEKMVAAPDAVVSELWCFIALSPEPVDTLVLNRERNDFHALHWRCLHSGPISRWYARALVREFEEPVNRFGYNLMDVSAKGASVLERSSGS